MASCVVFRNAKPAKKDYRHFNIKTVDGPDDFASMQEVLTRRCTRMMQEDPEDLPQLIVVDGGGKGAAERGCGCSGVDRPAWCVVSVVGIAKRLEEIYFPGDSVPLYIDKNSETLRVIQSLRDEAHRFGITHHRDRRSKSQTINEAGLYRRDRAEVKGDSAPQIPVGGPDTRGAAPEQLVELLGRSKGMKLYAALHP